ncbi:hypothetical protein HYV30_00585 [Candidatus Kaiserbacteria bacterium]|nr:hypothetical protein [Candidatus Kaiserbacteria bacterium]
MNTQPKKISNGVKKILLASALLAALVPVAAFASSITLAPASVATTEGKSFSVAVAVDPASGKAYTARANLSFDPSAVTLVGFSFAPKWMQLPQEGYDLEDNAGGKLAKTGGYPGGITTATVLGTATFRAKTTGVTTISATGDSLILDASNQNAVSGAQGSVRVSIAAVPVAPQPAASTETAPIVSTAEAVPATTTLDLAEAVTEAGTAVALSPLDSFLTLGTGSAAVASLVTLIVLLVVGAGIWLWRRERARY